MYTRHSIYGSFFVSQKLYNTSYWEQLYHRFWITLYRPDILPLIPLIGLMAFNSAKDLEEVGRSSGIQTKALFKNPRKPDGGFWCMCFGGEALTVNM
jgi:hypothetical protein